jgi:hypothetical protein
MQEIHAPVCRVALSSKCCASVVHVKDDSLNANLSQGHTQRALKKCKKFVLKETLAKDLTGEWMERLKTTPHLELKSGYL